MLVGMFLYKLMAVIMTVCVLIPALIELIVMLFCRNFP